MHDRARKTSRKPEPKTDAMAPVERFRHDGRHRADVPAASTGRPLASDVRTFFESRFTHDFSHVRVHTDPEAAGLAEQLGAFACTINDDIFFREGSFAPRTESGRALLAHELAHVAQQRDQPGPSAAPEISQPGDQAELEADAAGAQAAAGRPAAPVTGRAAKIYRQPTPPAGPAGTPAVTRTVFLDTNVFLEVGRGNEQVARNLRAMAADPHVRRLTGRGVLNELVRTEHATADEIAAYRAMIDKFHIEVVDAGMAKRVATYETYAQYEQSAHSAADPEAFQGQGLERLEGRPFAKQEVKTLEDLPHVAEAHAAGAEVWTHDVREQRSARALGVSVARESGDRPPGGGPTSVENILRLLPEISTDDLPKYGGTPRHPPGGSAGQTEAHPGTVMPARTSPMEAHPGTVMPARTSPMEAHPGTVMPQRGGTGRIASIGMDVAGSIAQAGLEMLIDYWQAKIEADFDQEMVKEWWRDLEPEIQTAANRLTPTVDMLLQETKSRNIIYANVHMDMVYTMHIRPRRGLPAMAEWRVINLKLMGVDASTQNIQQKGEDKLESVWYGELWHRPFTYSVPIVEPKPVMTISPAFRATLRSVGSQLDNVIGDLRQMEKGNRAESIEGVVTTFLRPARWMVERSELGVEVSQLLLGNGIHGLESIFGPNLSQAERNVLGLLYIARRQLEALLENWPMTTES